jgi:DNA polymerase III delta prime subunit
MPIQSTRVTSKKAFCNHPQIPLIIDTLARKNNHHILLAAPFSANYYPIFISALAEHIQSNSYASILLQSSIHIIEINNAHDLQASSKVMQADAMQIFIHYSAQGQDSILYQQVQAMQLPNWRFIAFCSNSGCNLTPDKDFTLITLNPLQDEDLLALLTQQSQALENYHQVIISQEIIFNAYALACRYLNTRNTVGETLLLIDSAAIHAKAHNKQSLTLTILIDVVSRWTQIPVAQLQNNQQFNALEFEQALAKNIYGQDAALFAITKELRYAYSPLQDKKGVLATFLFIGLPGVGKKTTAKTLAKQLYANQHAIFHIDLRPVTDSASLLASHAFCETMDSAYYTLAQVIREKPYAILIFDHFNPEQLPAVKLLEELTGHGKLTTTAGETFHFQQAIIIFIWTINDLNYQSIVAPDTSPQDISLMQLVAGTEQSHSSVNQAEKEFQQARALLQPMIGDKISWHLFNNWSFIPFVPLNKAAIEKIIKNKLQTLIKQLTMRYHVTLQYANEIIPYLANTVLSQLKDHAQISINHALREPLYANIEYTLCHEPEHLHTPYELVLQLNEMGNAIKCQWAIAQARTTQTRSI